MKMEQALQQAAGPGTRPEDILGIAERLARGGALRPIESGPAAPRRPAQAPVGEVDNLTTLRACQGLLSRTIALLE